MKKFILIAILALSVLFSSQYVSANEETEHDCTKCHQLTNEEAEMLLKEGIPDVRILDIQPSPVKGMWEISLESQGQKGLYYIDYSKKLLVAGAIFNIAFKENLTQARLDAINKVDVSTIPLDDAIVLGDEKAPVRVVVFTDPDCPYCAKLHEELKKVVAQKNDIAFYIKLFPLKMHPNAYEKSVAIVCEKSLNLLDDAFRKKDVPKPSCETKAVDETIELAGKLGISGTPTLILPNGTISAGFKEADYLISLIEKES